MELTQTYLHPRIGIPILTFVGRPLDPNKGLISFLDAIELVLETQNYPLFQLWIVGGDNGEIPKVLSHLKNRKNIREILDSGRVQVWGKVERIALPEIYRRSHVLIMPSHREPFGLVAIESMLCGCPVIGTNIGGLSDTIVHGRSGLKTDGDSPTALANSILFYIRNPDIRRTRGIYSRVWSKFAFEKKDAYENIRKLYYDAPSQQIQINWNRQEMFIQRNFEPAFQAFKKIIKTPTSVEGFLNTRYHITAKIRSGSNFYILKQFSERPSLREAVLCVGKTSRSATPAMLVENANWVSDATFLPKLLSADSKLGIIVYEWIESDQDLDHFDLKVVLNQIEDFGRNLLAQSVIDFYSNSINEFLKAANESSLAAVDSASLNLYSQFNKNMPIERETHPIVGLYRILIGFEKRAWVINEDILKRIEAIVRLSMNLVTLDGANISFCHGGFNKKHLISSKGKCYMIDIEHAGFAVGAYDLGTWMASLIYDGDHPGNIFRNVLKFDFKKEYFLSGVQWLVYTLSADYLIEIHHGNMVESSKRFKKIFYDLALTLDGIE